MNDNKCECCGYENPPDGLKEYTDPTDTRLLCKPCACTLTSTYASNRSVYRDQPIAAMQTICWGINRILDEIKKQ